jgi:hypothetical protein
MNIKVRAGAAGTGTRAGAGADTDISLTQNDMAPSTFGSFYFLIQNQNATD